MRELAADLSEDERELLFKLGEEDPFCGIFLDENRPGLYLPSVRTTIVQSRRKI